MSAAEERGASPPANPPVARGGRAAPAFERLWDGLYGSPIYPLLLPRLGGSRPACLLTDIWPGDGARGRTLMGGVLMEDASGVPLGGEPWNNGTIADALQRFAWLRDLRAVGGINSRQRARDLVRGWLDRYETWHAFAWRPELIAERLCAWLAAYAFFADSADDAFQARLLTSVARQARHLGRVMGRMGRGHER
ncbi:MAG: hypothetical protein ACREB3_17585, partial [Burkholderiales bacterium]